MNLEIYAYYDVQTLTSVFNAIAAIMGGSGFLSLLKTAALLGMLMAFSQMLIGKRLEGLHWFMGMFIVYGMIFIPRANVVIVDRLSSQPPTVVANVPLGLAFFGHVTSEVGDFLTTQYESNFALPDDLKYQQNGLMFGNTLVSESRRMVIASPTLRNDLFAFVRNCTIYDMLAGRIDPNVYSQSTDLWTLMGNTSQARMTTINNGNTSEYCNDAYNILNGELQTAVQNAEAQYGMILNPASTSAAVASSTLSSQLPAAYGFMMNASSSAEDIIKQNMMINLSNDAGAVIGQQLNDPNATQIALAKAQAEATANSNYVVMAKMAEDAMPRIKNMIEVVIYAVFPIVVIMLFMAGHHAGKIFKAYLMALVWVQLWPPLYAVINFLMTNSTATHMKALVPNGGLSIQTAIDAGQQAISDQAIAGYMVVLIPAIATALVKGSEMAMSSIADKMMSVQGVAAGGASQQVATGNESYGNFSEGNTSVNNDSRNTRHHQTELGASPNQISGTDLHGNQYTRHGDGRTGSYTQARNSFVIQGDIGQRVTAGLATRAAHEVSEGKDLQAKASSTMAATYAQAISNTHAVTHGRNLIDTRGEVSQSGSEDSIGSQTAMVTQLAKEFNLTRADAAQVIGTAGLGVAFNRSNYHGNDAQASQENRVDHPQTGPTRPGDPRQHPSSSERNSQSKGQRMDISGKAGLNASAGVSYETRLQDAYKSLRSGSHQDMASNARKFMTSTMHDTKFLDNHGVSDEDKRSIQAGLEQSQRFERDASAKFAEADRLSHEASYTKDKSFGAHYDPTQSTLMFKDIVQYASSNRMYGVRSEMDFMNITPDKQNDIVSRWAEDRNMVPKMSGTYQDGSRALTTNEEVRGKGNLAMAHVSDQGIGQVNSAWRHDQGKVLHTAGPAPSNPYGNIDTVIQGNRQDINQHQEQVRQDYNNNAGDVIHTQYNDDNKNTMGPLTGGSAPRMSPAADAAGRAIESTVAGVENRVNLVTHEVDHLFHHDSAPSHNQNGNGQPSGNKKGEVPTPQ